MNTLEQQRERLENEIISTKERICQIKDSKLPDLKALNLLNETVERNMQLIGMIEQHLRPVSRQYAAD